MRRISLSQGFYAEVDDEDYWFLSLWSWFAMKKGRNYYATRMDNRKVIYIHRVILDCKKGETVDHANQNGLDNRRSNLRLCTQSQNGMNKRKTHGRGKYKGVYFNTEPGRIKRFQAYINVNKKRISLGIYMTEEEAAKAYNKAALKYHGEYACLNPV